VQLTSAAYAAKATRSSGRRAVLDRLDQPLVAGLIAQAGWLAFVTARLAGWADGRLDLFIMAGTRYSHAPAMYPKLHQVPLAGYDGQFYYRFALNPFNWNATAYGITIDHAYRYTRIGYSLVAWFLALGGHGQLLPAVLVLVNLNGVAAMGYLGAMLARDSGRHALWGLLFAAYFGLVISVGRDTSEPLADACLLGGLLAYRRARYLLAAALISYGVFTNEPILAMPVALAVTRLYQIGLSRVGRGQFRPGKPDLVWMAPGSVYVLLQGIQRLVVHGTAGSVADASANLTLPFKALIPGLYLDVHRMSWTHLGRYDYNLIEFLALTAFVVAALLALRSTTAPIQERATFIAFVLVEMVLASGQFWDSVFGDGRTFIDAYLMACVVLLAAPRQRVTNRRLGVLAVIAVAVLLVVARRRALFE
jgi:hypothetical protein